MFLERYARPPPVTSECLVQVGGHLTAHSLASPYVPWCFLAVAHSILDLNPTHSNEVRKRLLLLLGNISIFSGTFHDRYRVLSRLSLLDSFNDLLHTSLQDTLSMAFKPETGQRRASTQHLHSIAYVLENQITHSSPPKEQLARRGG